MADKSQQLINTIQAAVSSAVTKSLTQVEKNVLDAIQAHFDVLLTRLTTLETRVNAIAAVSTPAKRTVKKKAEGAAETAEEGAEAAAETKPASKSTSKAKGFPTKATWFKDQYKITDNDEFRAKFVDAETRKILDSDDKVKKAKGQDKHGVDKKLTAESTIVFNMIADDPKKNKLLNELHEAAKEAAKKGAEAPTEAAEPASPAE